MRPFSVFTSPMWRWPAWLGLLTAIGLVAALVADGWPDLLSSLALGLPVAVGAWYGWRRPRGASASHAATPSLSASASISPSPTRQAAHAPSTSTSEER